MTKEILDKKEIIKKIQNAGVVGAGGGGFPSHVKMAARIDTLIANGAECELLLSSDRYLMETRADEIIQGLRFAERTTGAKDVYIALKKKYAKAVEKIRHILGTSSDIDFFLLGNYYPSGDEFELVYDITGRIIPEGGIPLDVGAVVTNVNSLVNIFQAVHNNKPVTTRWLTVAGEINEPYIAEVPVGISAGELVDAGKPKLTDYKIIVGGPMMGKVADRSYRITKLCGGLIVLPVDHPVIIKQSANISMQKRRGASMCDQCFDCTIVCPRHLLGHDLSPHMIMRNLFIAPENSKVHLTNAYLCCDCGLCNMFACPLELSPRDLLINTRDELKMQKIKYPDNKKDLTVHPEREFRRVNTDRLMARLAVRKYEIHDFEIKIVTTNEVVIPLSQHIGIPASPTVREGDKIKSGYPIGEISSDSLGARVHSSIDGIVTAVNNNCIKIEKRSR